MSGTAVGPAAAETAPGFQLCGIQGQVLWARYVFGSDSWSHFSILAAIKAAIIESVIALSQSMQRVKVNSNHRLILISWSERAEGFCKSTLIAVLSLGSYMKLILADFEEPPTETQK